MFKIGDRVCFTDDSFVGTIVEFDENGDPGVQWEFNTNGKILYYYKEQLKLVKEKQNKFKIGDFVRNKNTGSIGQITNIKPPKFYVVKYNKVTVTNHENALILQENPEPKNNDTVVSLDKCRKVTKREVTTIVEEKDEYPCIKKHDTEHGYYVITLFTSLTNGTVLDTNRSMYKTGQYKSDWNGGAFKPYDGSVTLKND